MTEISETSRDQSCAWRSQPVCPLRHRHVRPVFFIPGPKEVR
jgi:hypothetical protein